MISSPKEHTTHFSRQILVPLGGRGASDGDDRPWVIGGLIYTTVHHKRGQDPTVVPVNMLTKFGFQRSRIFLEKLFDYKLLKGSAPWI